MKLFYDDNFNELDYQVEINESTGSKNYVIKGVFSTPEMRNRNGRIYSRKLWEDNVQAYQEELRKNTDNTLMEAEHPPRSTVDKWKAVAKIRKLEMRPDGKVYGEAVILNNNSAESNQIKALIEAGVPIGVSSRGVGRLGKGNIVEEYKLITYDIVSSPSDYNALTQGFNESMILENKEFKITEDGRVVCDESGCRLEESNKEVECNDCTTKAEQLLEALKKFTKKEEPSKYAHLPQDKIDTLFEMGLIEASEYAKLKACDDEEEREEKKAEKRKEQSEKPERDFSKDEPQDSEDQVSKDSDSDDDGDDTNIEINVDNDDNDDEKKKKKPVKESYEKDSRDFSKYKKELDKIFDKLGNIISKQGDKKYLIDFNRDAKSIWNTLDNFETDVFKGTDKNI